MKKSIIIQVCIISIMILTITADITAKVRRYKSAHYSQTKNELATINLFGASVEEGEKKAALQKDLWLLNDRGQKELIKSMNDRFKTDNEKFISSLNNVYMSEKSENNDISLVQKDVQMIFSIARNRLFNTIGSSGSTFSTADRIEYLKFTLIIPDNCPVRFIKWNKYTTEYANIDIADVSFSKGYEVSAGVGGEGSKTNDKKVGSDDNNYLDVVNGLTVTPSVNGKATASSTEAQKIKYRYMQFSGNISDKRLSVEEEGMREIDLAGNVIANVSMQFNEHLEYVFKAGSLLDEKGKFNKTENVTINYTLAKVPEAASLPDELQAILKMKYIYRHVTNKKGQKTFFEWDDKVEYYEGIDEKKVTLFRKADCLPKFHYIGLQGQKTAKIKIFDNSGNSFALTFSTFKEALKFRDWLRNFPCDKSKENSPVVLDGYTLKMSVAGNDILLTKRYINSNSLNLLPFPEYQ